MMTWTLFYEKKNRKNLFNYNMTKAANGALHPRLTETLLVGSSPGVLDNNPEQLRNKLKMSAYVLETT